MPGFLLNAGSTVLCMHAGQAKPAVPDLRVKVDGKPVVTQSCLYTVAGCAFPPPPAGTGPCVTANWLMGAVRVKASGVPVLLQDSQAMCTPTATPLNVVVAQFRVKGQ